VARHPNAVGTLAVALFIQAEILHSFIIKGEPVLALVEAVLDWVGRDGRTVFTVAETQLLDVLLVVLAIFVVLDFNDGFES
jgi:hypothetical protein